jgi:tRNA (guanine37-N1)-methyltransferase
VLTGGNHGAIARWRAEQSLRLTRERRPDLLDRSDP